MCRENKYSVQWQKLSTFGNQVKKSDFNIKYQRYCRGFNPYVTKHVNIYCAAGDICGCICWYLVNLTPNIITADESYYNSSSVCLFVCLFVCSLSPSRSFDGSLPNLVGVCRWTSHLPLRGSFSKRSMARRVNGSFSLSTILYMHQPHATAAKAPFACWLSCRV